MEQKVTMDRKGMAEAFLGEIDEKYLQETIQFSVRKKQGRYWKMALKTAACIALVAVLGISSLSAATAAGSLKAYEYLYKLDPALAEKMSPVAQSCVDQDIEMRVAGIYVHGDIVDVYVTMQDLTGSRLDGTADLFDSYSIHTNLDQWGGCTLVDFDEETCTATFLIKAGLYDNKIEGKKMTFSVSRILSGKQEEWVDLKQINLSEVVSQKADYRLERKVQELIQSPIEHDYSGSGTGLPMLLVPNEAQTFAPVETGAKITAYGMVDGKLHVQVYYEDVNGRDDHGDIQLVDANGVYQLRSEVAYFRDKDRVGRYEEYEFNVSAEELPKYQVIGYFSTGAKLYEGNWKITFPIVNMEEAEEQEQIEE